MRTLSYFEKRATHSKSQFQQLFNKINLNLSMFRKLSEFFCAIMYVLSIDIDVYAYYIMLKLGLKQIPQYIEKCSLVSLHLFIKNISVFKGRKKKLIFRQ